MVQFRQQMQEREGKEIRAGKGIEQLDMGRFMKAKEKEADSAQDNARKQQQVIHRRIRSTGQKHAGTTENAGHIWIAGKAAEGLPALQDASRNSKTSEHPPGLGVRAALCRFGLQPWIGWQF